MEKEMDPKDEKLPASETFWKSWVPKYSKLYWDYLLGIRLLKVLVPMALGLMILYAAGMQLNSGKIAVELGPWFKGILTVMVCASTYFFVRELGGQYYLFGCHRGTRPLIWALLVLGLCGLGLYLRWDANALVLSLAGTGGVAAILILKIKTDGKSASFDPVRVRGDARAALLEMETGVAGAESARLRWPSVALVPIEDRKVWEDATREVTEVVEDMRLRAGAPMPKMWEHVAPSIENKGRLQHDLGLLKDQKEQYAYRQMALVARVQSVRGLIEE